MPTPVLAPRPARRTARPPGGPGRRRGRGGATLMEFALTAPVFILILFGIFDLGWLAYQRSALETAVIVGCRVGALRDPGVDDADLPELELAVSEAVMTALDEVGAPCDTSACTVLVETFGSNPTRNLRCSVTRDLDPLVGFVLPRLTLRAAIAARMERQR
jgi:Flp pilus assembly protein TadG